MKTSRQIIQASVQLNLYDRPVPEPKGEPVLGQEAR
jgi:hypothetical protein